MNKKVKMKSKKSSSQGVSIEGMNYKNQEKHKKSITIKLENFGGFEN